MGGGSVATSVAVAVAVGLTDEPDVTGVFVVEPLPLTTMITYTSSPKKAPAALDIFQLL